MSIVILAMLIILRKSLTSDISSEILQVDEEIDKRFGDFFKGKRYFDHNTHL